MTLMHFVILRMMLLPNLCSKVDNLSCRKPLKRLDKTRIHFNKSSSKFLPLEKQLPLDLNNSLRNDNLTINDSVGSPQPICQSGLVPCEEDHSSNTLVSVTLPHQAGKCHQVSGSDYTRS